MKTMGEANLFNKSELVRRAYRERPAASNGELREHIRQKYGVNVASNLIIQAIGRERDRIAFLASHHSLQIMANQYLANCGGNLAVAMNHLRLAY